MFFTDFFNLVLVCKDIEPRYGRTRTRGFWRVYLIGKDFEKHIHRLAVQVKEQLRFYVTCS